MNWMRQKRAPWALATVVCVATLASSAYGHKLSPKGTKEENRLSDVRGTWLSALERSATAWGLDTFGDPVHEEITDRIYGCDGNICGGAEPVRAPAAVLAGVRWNDDPPFRISAGEARDTSCKPAQTIRFQMQPRCWYQLFMDAKRGAAAGRAYDAESHSALLYRSHFGDLQFLHAMASADGIQAEDTRRAVLDWSEFNWRVMLGEYALDTELKSVEIATVRDRFGKSGWYVQDLYTLGSPGLRSSLRDVAFGSLLHVLQDSFAEGHVERGSPAASRTCSLGTWQMPAPGLITEFHAYNHQDSGLHGAADTRGALESELQDDPDVVDVGRLLLRAYRERSSWEQVKPFMECIYALRADPRVSSAGEQFAAVGR